jgi:hypothetical protein
MNNITGQWRLVYGAYLISDCGKVYSLLCGRMLRPTYNKKVKYYYVHIRGKGSEYIHRLVMLGFHGHPSEGEVVDHIDRNRKNNTLKNLRYLPKTVNDGQRLDHAFEQCYYKDYIEAIRKLRGVMSSVAVAKRYGIKTPTTVRNIWAGMTWATRK